MNHKHKFKLYGRSKSGFAILVACRCGKRMQFWRAGIQEMLTQGGKFKDSFQMGAW